MSMHGVYPRGVFFEKVNFVGLDAPFQTQIYKKPENH